MTIDLRPSVYRCINATRVLYSKKYLNHQILLDENCEINHKITHNTDGYVKG